VINPPPLPSGVPDPVQQGLDGLTTAAGAAARALTRVVPTDDEVKSNEENKVSTILESSLMLVPI